MGNTQSYDALARSRPRAMGLVASALLLAISVDYATAAGTVPPKADREDVSGTLARNDGDADDKTLTIDDAGATLDGPGLVGLLDPGTQIHGAESAAFVEVYVHRYNGSTGIVSVRFQLEGGTATPEVDFAPSEGTITFADGQAGLKSFRVQIIDDKEVEGEEIIPVRLVRPPGSRAQINGCCTSISISDNDSAPALSLNTSTVAGCQSVTGKLQLAYPAPAGGRVVSIRDTLVSATMPANITVPGGATTVTFPITTTPVATLVSGTITADFGGTLRTHKLSVRPIGMLSVTLVPTRVAATNPVVGTAKLECKAAPGPITVDLASSNAAIANPVAASVVVSQGLQSVPFDVATSQVLSMGPAVISGTANGIKKSKTLTVMPAASVSPTTLRFGNVTVGATGGPLATTLTNKGKTSFTIGSFGITGTHASSFAMTENCPPILAAGASCSINVTFKPTVAKRRSASLRISTSATAVPLSVLLSGTGT